LEIRANPSAYVLAFSYYDMKNLLDIDVRGGDYIYSATEPFNEEMYLDIKKLVEWIRLFELRLHGLVVEGGDIKAERGWHASGHISPEDLVRFVEIADPDVIIPVHTKNREWFREMFGERVREGFGA
jgi:ribonuclease J